jgi:rod shape-determining protein MreC
VHHAANGTPEVAPMAQLNRLEIVRIFDYGLAGITPPEPKQRLTAAHH